ncbi:PAS domain-containing sensor histidine kinase [Opitutus sp. ER46]|uniref:PAS domain-containing hybrid sensor histidine kinase/response regulator n=1 Tax=Opitutus sp. ER46 TaxID=2161864 RepID=UPI001304ECB3|nr:PAS domain-containing sensor histidine kinase [Opitutus sp. ER46]
MKPRLRISLSWLLVSAVALASILMTGLFGWLGYSVASRWMREETAARLDLLVNELEWNVEIPLWNFDDEQFARVIETALQGNDIRAVVFQEPNGMAETFIRRLGGGMLRQPGIVAPPEFASIEKVVEVRHEGRFLGKLRVWVSDETLAGQLRRLRVTTIAAVGLICVSLVVLLYWMIWKWVLRPIQYLEHYSRVASEGCARPALPARESFVTEIGSLGDSITRTLDLLDARFAEVQVSEAKYRLLAEHVGDLIWTVDRAGVLAYISPSCRALLDFAPEELRGRTFASLLTPASATIFERMLEEAWSMARVRGGVAKGEYEMVSRAGTTVWTEVVLEGLNGGGTEQRQLVGASRDITERKRYETELRAAEEKYRGIFEHSPLGLVQCTREGRLLAINPAGARILGYESSEEPVAGAPSLLDLVNLSADDRQRLEAQLESAGYVENFECEIRRRDGTLRWISVAVSSLAVDGEAPGSYQASIEDITRRKNAEDTQAKMEQQLRRTQKLEAIGTLAGGIAHDFNNILGIILGYAHFVRERVEDRPEVVADLDCMQKATDRGRNLVRQILTFCRRTAQERKPGDVRIVVKEAVGFLRSTVPASIQIVTELPEGLPQVAMDSTQIYQVVLNLCTNSVHAMRGGSGKLTVTLEAVYLDQDAVRTLPGLVPGSHIKLRVADTGHGMDEQTQKRIFEPFFTTKAPGEGTGLGLSVVHGIVRDHRGAVSVYSRPGEGTAFNVFLPTARDAAAEAPEAAPAIARGHGERILYVDDEPLLADYVHRGLTQLGYQVATCTHAPQAFEQVVGAEQTYDLIITDYAMPKLTGLDLALRLRAHGIETPIVMVSGYFGDLQPDALKAAGIAEMVYKPVPQAQLAQLVERHLQRRVVIS